MLREPQGELLVEGVEAADVGQDHDPGAGRVRRPGRGTPRNRLPSAASSVELGRVERAAGDRRDRAAGCRDRSTSAAPPRAGTAASIVALAPRRALGSVASRGGRMPRDACRPLVVQKFGGSSVADADRIRRVARRIARERAAGSRPRRRRLRDGRHDRRAARPRGGDHRRPGPARAGRAPRDRRAPERDAACRWPSTRSASPAISLTGPQAGITTDGRYGRARIAGIEPAPRPRASSRRARS